ncbi:sodium channel modifier 1 isoform X2 [Heterodontus francisci]|uniref:sodium channel modifier 1 isoform X2 n=1 Tax=Heterodontus francisci TaxID=7792 RepID=UPI00355C0369
MAFKREGDDLSQLNALRKRRVADLLASYIPEDEAILMKNGRYACSVCYNRPVFDTVDMLAVHRTGKRHVAGLQRFYRNKWSLRLEIQKRRHQQHVREEEEEAGAGGQQTGTELAPLLSQTRRITHHALLKAAPYNSCCKRTRPGGEGPSPSPGCGDAAATEAGGGPELPRSAGGASITDAQPTASLPAGKGTQPGSHVEAERAKKRRRGKAPAASRSSAADPERQKLVEHYLTLRSSGWIQDSCGRWTRDETVEFDSDEEEPPPLSLP